MVVCCSRQPALEIDGQVVAQSHAIERYLATEFGLNGATEFETVKIDGNALAISEMIIVVVPVFQMSFLLGIVEVVGGVFNGFIQARYGDDPEKHIKEFYETESFAELLKSVSCFLLCAGHVIIASSVCDTQHLHMREWVL